MGSWRALGVLAGAVAVSVLGATLLPAQSQGHSEEVIRVCDQNRPGFSHDVDTGEEGDSPGDFFVFVDKLRDTRTGRKAGRLMGELTFIRPVGNRDALIGGQVIVFFPIGKLSASVGGRFSDFEDGTSFPVTGGTGHFQHATGSVFIKSGRCDGKPGLKMKIETKH